jgi:hypothetical protein
MEPLKLKYGHPIFIILPWLKLCHYKVIMYKVIKQAQQIKCNTKFNAQHGKKYLYFFYCTYTMINVVSTFLHDSFKEKNM